MHKLLFALVISLIVLASCKKADSFITDGDAALEFSTDTLKFDTVFTTLGSATRFVRVYNPHNQDIKISKITVKSGANSRFRFNVDGIVFDGEANDLEIAANDSLYIFAEVTVNPDDPLEASPFVIHDALVFETNGNKQEVTMEAWGQNANYLTGLNKNGVSILSCALSTFPFDDPRPYVVYGILVIDSCTVLMPEGCQVYIHGGITRETADNGEVSFGNDGALFFTQSGKLKIEGTRNNPVIIQGDRLEAEFQDVSGQWAGIRLSSGSRGNEVNHMVMKNSIIGIIVDSAAELSLKNSRIENTQSLGLVGLHANIQASNCLFHSNGAGAFSAIYGGNYSFDFCTFANYGVDATAVQLSNALCLDQSCADFLSFPVNANFRNSIIFGNREDEVSLFDRTPESGDFNYKLENCVVRVDELDDENGFPDFFDHCNPCLNAGPDDLLFVNPSEDDYHLDSLSVATGLAVPLPDLDFDLEGIMRDAAAPDVGCFENTF